MVFCHLERSQFGFSYFPTGNELMHSTSNNNIVVAVQKLASKFRCFCRIMDRLKHCCNATLGIKLVTVCQLDQKMWCMFGGPPSIRFNCLVAKPNILVIKEWSEGFNALVCIRVEENSNGPPSLSNILVFQFGNGGLNVCNHSSASWCEFVEMIARWIILIDIAWPSQRRCKHELYHRPQLDKVLHVCGDKFL